MSKLAMMFRRPKQTVTQAGPTPAEMRGRGEEISDPGALSWQVLWEALKTEPPADDPSTITQELGLDQEQELHQPYRDGGTATEFSGTRHGRRVALRMGVARGIRAKPFNEVFLA